ncbi:DUF1846 domain-containing protein [Faecalicoccus pleomorphus]|uniref:DUF1846 domain-containing protein n=1 Tax=Faecalicoccus pleomorphus TaxID=1323 RepID=UPI00232E7FF2|nr:DUF1846 domain-containing protein [Faecalicoccus pleomorphus]MDB7990167.1 DUF1846 domain-containing protein [Faecalicoccus pleomorphus]
MKIGFDNQKYLAMQSEHIKERIGQFGDKLYLEFGGKLFDDYHASRVLPGFEPDSKLQMLLQLKDQAEIVIVISAKDIQQNKVRQDLGITYQEDVLRLIKEFRKVGLFVGSVVITQYTGQNLADSFKQKLKRRKINCYYHYYIDGYPTNTQKIISKDGFGKNDYIKTERPLVVVTAPGPGSGKMATCLSQLYHDHVHGIKAGYAKYETFPIWNLPLTHSVNLAYEAATADLNDVNMIDPFHLEAYNKVTVNYNRDIEIFPVLRNIFEAIYGESPYKSPTDMGVNMAGFCISDDEACQDASKQEIIRRYFNSKTRFVREQCKEEEVHKQEMVMKQAGVSEEDRKCVVAARQKEKESHSFSAALELADGTIVTGKTTHLMGACSSVLMNAIKYLAGIEDEALLIEPEAFGPIQKLKTKYLGSVNPRLHTNEILIALSLSAQSNPLAQKAMEQLKQLKGTQAHITCDVAHVDASVYSNLGIQITFEAEKH